jgi:drug/metabolite transporter (DMT)-like permease
MGVAWGQVLALSCAVCWALAVILLHRSGESLPAFELNLFKHVLSLLLLVPTLAWTLGFALPEYPLNEVFIALFSGFLGIGVADTWYLRALNMMGASRTGIVASVFSPFVILLSVVFLGESLSGMQLLGFVLVMAGVLLVTWHRSRHAANAGTIRKAALLAIGGVFMMAVGIVMVKGILETRPFLWTIAIRLVGGIAGMVLYLALRRRWAEVWHQFRRPQPWLWIVSGSFMGGYLSMMLWLAGYMLLPASEASILNETSNAWIVLLAWLMLGETIDLRKLAGLLLTLAGVVTMLLV